MLSGGVRQHCAHQQHAGPALEDTELQFFELLDVASGEIPVHLKLTR